MNENKKVNLIYQNDIKRIVRRVCRGFKNQFKNPLRILFLMIYLIFIYYLYLWINNDVLLQYVFLEEFNFCVSLVIIFVLICLFLYFNGVPLGNKRIRNAFHQVGLTNALGEAPELVIKSKGKFIKYTFENVGIPPSVWEDKKIDIESVLGMSIVKIEYFNGNTKVVIECTDAGTIPQLVKWKKAYLQTLPKIALGICNYGTYIVDIDKTPHFLIGGSTGSGKTVLLKSIIEQFALNDAKIYIADYKGGIDFPIKWCNDNNSKLSTNYNDTIDQLLIIIEEMNSRKIKFLAKESPNLTAYNKVSENRLPRLLFACDELSQLFDKTGASKEDKEKLEKISGLVSTIARLGRAYGCHLALATQRPDANVLNGQIKNNLDIRIAGRCDNVLSQMILDSTEASKRIVGFNSGRFITKDGVVFQGFYKG